MCILKLMGSRPGQGYHKVFIPHLAMILYSPKPRNITFQKKKNYFQITFKLLGSKNTAVSSPSLSPASRFVIIIINALKGNRGRADKMIRNNKNDKYKKFLT